MTLYLAYLRDWWRRVRELLRRPRTRRGPRCPAPGLAWDAQATGLQHPPTGELAPEVLVFDDLPPVRSYPEFLRRYLPREAERRRRARLTAVERATEDGRRVVRDALDTLPFWEVATYISACLAHPIGAPSIGGLIVRKPD